MNPRLARKILANPSNYSRAAIRAARKFNRCSGTRYIPVTLRDAGVYKLTGVAAAFARSDEMAIAGGGAIPCPGCIGCRT